MAKYAELHITIRPKEEPAGHPVEMRLKAVDNQSEAGYPASGTGIAYARINPRELSALDPLGYGRALGNALFADPRLRQGLSDARASLQSTDAALRIRLDTAADDLHPIHWETLHDPNGYPLFNGSQILLSRFLATGKGSRVGGRAPGLKALVVVANPPYVSEYADPELFGRVPNDEVPTLAPVDVARERARAEQGLADSGMEVRTLATREAGCGPATLNGILDELDRGYDVLYLVCHGALRHDGQTLLFLEDGPVDGVKLVERIGSSTQPRLIILASCESAGDKGKVASGTLSALGPRLVVDAGVPAVIAMQGRVKMATIACFMPAFFNALAKDGQIDRAMGIARERAFGDGCSDYWMPALFMRLSDGLLWSPHAAAEGSTVSEFQDQQDVNPSVNPSVNPAGADETPSIAVLPFANLSPDKENEYFGDGLAEEILNLLAKIPGLKVIARTSSFAFRGKDQDITKVAGMLGVRTILEGSVRRAWNRIRVSAQLIEAENGSHLWSERYDRDMTDVFAVQDEIGQAISEALKVRLAPPTQPINIEAWQNYLKGRYHFLRLTPESMAKGKRCMEQALAIDPTFAPVYAWMGVYYLILATIGIRKTVEVAPKAKWAMEKARAIDPANSEAHSGLAAMAAIFDYDWKAAETHQRKAMEVEPIQPLTRYTYVIHYLLPLGRISDAIEQCRLALESDPLSMNLHAGMLLSLYYARQYREAIEWARRGMEIDANSYLVWFLMGLAQLRDGFALEAIASLKRGVELAPWFPPGAWVLAAAYHVAGDYAQSQEWVRKLGAPLWRSGARLVAAAYHIAGDRQHSQEWIRKLGGSDSFATALYYAATGEVDAMFETLEGAYRQRDYNLIGVAVDPAFDPWHDDPRFQSLLRRMNLA